MLIAALWSRSSDTPQSLETHRSARDQSRQLAAGCFSVNPLGAKGLGEIGIVSVAPAIANAVFHAIGRRIRELPITLDKLL